MKKLVRLPKNNGEWRYLEKKKNKIKNSNYINQVKDNKIYASFIRQATTFKRLPEYIERRLGLRVNKYKDKDAAKKLVIHNMRLAIKIAHQYRRAWTNLMDLIQEASTGMAIAANRWNPIKGARFGTYATYWIRAQLIKFLMTNARLIHTANTRAGRKVYFKLPQIKRRLLENGKKLTMENIAKEIKEDPKEVTKIIMRLNKSETSLFSKLDHSDSYTLQETLSLDEPTPEIIVNKYQTNKIIKDLIERFEKTIDNERDFNLWKRHIISYEPISLVALGKKYNISKQRMGQLANRLKLKFKKHILSELGPYTNILWLFNDQF